MSVLESLKKTFSFDEDYETFQEEVDAPETTGTDDNVIKPSFFKRREKDSVRVLPAPGPVEAGQALNIVRPERFDDAMTIVGELQSGQIVVINTSRLDLKTAQRLLDFVSGATFALAGEIQEVMEAVYVVTPAGVALHNAVRTDSMMKNIFGLK